MMYHGDDTHPQDQAADTAMTALYRQLDRHDLPADPPFDTEAGLQDLTGRIRRELASQPSPHANADQGRQPSDWTQGEPASDRLQGNREAGTLVRGSADSPSRVRKRKKSRRGTAKKGAGTLVFPGAGTVLPGILGYPPVPFGHGSAKDAAVQFRYIAGIRPGMAAEYLRMLPRPAAALILQAADPADAARVVASMRPKSAAAVLADVPVTAAAQILGRTSEEVAGKVITRLPVRRAVRLLRSMKPRQAAAVITHMKQDRASTVLDAAPKLAAAVLRHLDD